MSNKKYEVSLNYEELLVLDGKSSESVQNIIEQAKQENLIGLDDFSNEIIRKAIEQGKLSWGSKKISSCSYCSNKPYGYVKYERSSRYHRKGEPNYNKPFSYFGVDPFQGFIIFNGLSGMCMDCWRDKYLEKIVKYIVENDFPVELQKNNFAETRYKKDIERKCFECGKTMYESEMGRERTVMGDGTYPSACPHCGAKSMFLGKYNGVTGKFRMVKA